MSEDDGKLPPSTAESVVSFFSPRSSREQILGDLREWYATTPGNPNYAERSLKILSRAIPGKIILAFNAALFVGQACALAVSFAGASMSLSLLAGLIAALLALAVRDGYMYPFETPGEVLADALIAVTLLISSMEIMAVLASAPVVPIDVMLRGGAASLVSLFLVRLVLRKKRPGFDPTAAAYRSACVLNIMWAAAWALIQISGSPEDSRVYDVFLVLSVFVVGGSYKLRQKGINRMRKSNIIRFLHDDHDLNELERKLGMLWVPDGLTAEALGFACVLGQFAASILLPPQVDWLRAATTLVSSLLLFWLWRYIRNANRDAASLICTEIQKLEV